MILLTILLLVICVFIVFLKIYNIKCCNKAKNVKISVLMRKRPSYDKYMIVSSISSSLNNPKRKTGDFLDYFIEGMDDNSEILENNILDIYGVKGDE